MSPRSIALFPIFCALLAPVGAFAQPAVCASPAELPAGMASWAHPKGVKAAASAKDVPVAALVPGQAVTLALAPTPDVAYPLQPARSGSEASYGGLASFTVDRPGTWRVALGAGAWVDVVKDGAALTSTGHGHGPACTGIRKMVEFDLAPGDYVLQLAGSGDPQVTLLVLPLP